MYVSVFRKLDREVGNDIGTIPNIFSISPRILSHAASTKAILGTLS
jgi:hypothetical protein